MSDTEILDSLVKAEGSQFTNDPADAGGPTKFGITLATLSNELGKPATLAEVALLTEDKARDIYQKIYITPCKALPEPLRTTTIHTCVIRGAVTGRKMLQDLLGVTDDGVIGQDTLSAVGILPVSTWNTLLIGAMLHHFALTTNKRPTQLRFLRGWRARFLALL